MAASQPIENQQRSHEGFEKKHYMECTTRGLAEHYRGRPRGRVPGDGALAPPDPVPRPDGYRSVARDAPLTARHRAGTPAPRGGEERDTMAEYRVFQGKDTKQVDGHTTRPADPTAWYYEPSDYEGDVLYSASYPTEEEARTAAEMEFGEVE